MRYEPCKQCGNSDWYLKGEFSSCRPCHAEAQRRYLQNKRMGIEYSPKRLPIRSMEYLLTQGLKGSVSRAVTHCPRNHAYAGDNVRVENSNGRVHRRCKTCERDAKRVRYGLTPSPDPARLSDLLDES